MIDTIKLEIQTRQYSTENLAFLQESNDVVTGEIIQQRGKLRNLTVIIKPASIIGHKITVEGSIRKYFLSQCCLDDLTFADFLNAIAKLQSDLGIPAENMIKAKLLRLDIGLTINTAHPVSDYISAILEHSMIRTMAKFGQHGVQFTGANKKIVF